MTKGCDFFYLNSQRFWDQKRSKKVLMILVILLKNSFALLLFIFHRGSNFYQVNRMIDIDVQNIYFLKFLFYDLFFRIVNIIFSTKFIIYV